MKRRMITRKDRKEIATRIKQVRLQKQFDREEFADILYVTPFHVEQWETGKKIPRLEKINLIAFIFKLTPEWILYGE